MVPTPALLRKGVSLSFPYCTRGSPPSPHKNTGSSSQATSRSGGFHIPFLTKSHRRSNSDGSHSSPRTAQSEDDYEDDSFEDDSDVSSYCTGSMASIADCGGASSNGTAVVGDRLLGPADPSFDLSDTDTESCIFPSTGSMASNIHSTVIVGQSAWPRPITDPPRQLDNLLPRTYNPSEDSSDDDACDEWSQSSLSIASALADDSSARALTTPTGPNYNLDRSASGLEERNPLPVPLASSAAMPFAEGGSNLLPRFSSEDDEGGTCFSWDNSSRSDDSSFRHQLRIADRPAGTPSFPVLSKDTNDHVCQSHIVSMVAMPDQHLLPQLEKHRDHNDRSMPQEIAFDVQNVIAPLPHESGRTSEGSPHPTQQGPSTERRATPAAQSRVATRTRSQSPLHCAMDSYNDRGIARKDKPHQHHLSTSVDNGMDRCDVGCCENNFWVGGSMSTPPALAVVHSASMTEDSMSPVNSLHQKEGMPEFPVLDGFPAGASLDAGTTVGPCLLRSTTLRRNGDRNTSDEGVKPKSLQVVPRTQHLPFRPCLSKEVGVWATTSPQLAKNEGDKDQLCPTPKGLKGRLTTETMIQRLRLGSEASDAVRILRERDSGLASSPSLARKKTIHGVRVPDYKGYVAESIKVFRRDVLNISDRRFKEMKLKAYKRVPVTGVNEHC